MKNQSWINRAAANGAVSSASGTLPQSTNPSNWLNQPIPGIQQPRPPACQSPTFHGIPSSVA